ncbi:UbiA prenyltransferase family protein [Halalkalicoccus salilacus]|uniref:UbiA family prenyltransferase n=1 Tax=Halalkalicoccus salilacus TaxID=3117459 RepID=UPI00300F4C07
MNIERTSEPIKGLRAVVKPTFMLPAVGTAAAGNLLAPAIDFAIGIIHALAVATALYIAHLVDEYVDAYIRNEDVPSVSKRAIGYATAIATAVFLVLTARLWLIGAYTAVATTVPLLALAVLHAPVFDRHPVTVTVDYPIGIALAFSGGYLAQTDVLSGGVLGIAAVLAVLLSGLKISIDRLDRSFDQTIDKRTIPVLLGDQVSGAVAAAMHILAAVLVSAFAVVAVFPVTALAVVPMALLGAAVVFCTSMDQTVRLQMLLAYPITATLFTTQCAATECTFFRYVGKVGLLG